MMLTAATALILVGASLPAAISTGTSTSTGATATAQNPRHRHLLDTSGVSPRSPLITAAQWLTFLSTEVGEEFEADDTYATTPELAELAEAIWTEASRFEYARAIRDGAEETAGPGGLQLYPFLICDAKEATTQAERAGYARRQRVADAIRAASVETGIPLPGDDEGSGGTTSAPYEVIINDENVWCGYGLLNGIVAEAVEVDGVVQPVIMSMKMAKNTVNKLLKGVEDFYNATERLEEEKEAEAEEAEETATAEDPDQRFLRNLQDKESSDEGGIGPDDPVMGLPEAVKNIVFPSATITMCPGALSEESYNDLMEQAVETTDLTAEMTAWLLEQTGKYIFVGSSGEPIDLFPASIYVFA